MRFRSENRSPWKRGSLRVEITVALVAKTVLLYAIWATFFSHPTDKPLNGETVQRALLGGSSAVTAPQDESHHARP